MTVLAGLSVLGDFMNSTVYAKGADIYSAFVHGAECKYNRSTDDYSSYETQIAKSYEYWLKCAGGREQVRAIKRKTKGDWRNAYLPLNIAFMHKRIAGQPAEMHARVYLADAPSSVVDIPWGDWEKMEKSSPKQMY
jgi:hypothetical protein